MYTNLHFRFETYVTNPKTHKKIPVYKDIVCNNGNLKELESIPCPIMKDQIKVKVLKLPQRPDVKIQIPNISKQQYMQIYRHELNKREEVKQETYL